MQHQEISEQLIEQLPDAVFVVDPEGVIVLVNAQAEALFGWRRDELVGRPIETLVPPAARAAHPIHRAGYVQDARVRPMGDGLELSGARKDGTQFPAEISLSAIETATGSLITAVVRDATARMKTQAKFQGLMEAAPDAMLGVDGDGLIRLVNTQAEKLFGWTRDELLGRPIETLVPDQVRVAHRGHRHGYFAEPQVRAMGAGIDLAARRKDGTEFPAEISLSSIESEDGLLVTAAVRDVTERKAFEGEVALARDVAERAARSRQDFLANMSHEIRTPMNAIIGMTSLLLDSVLEHQQRDYVETVRASGEHLLTIINDILDYAKIDAGKLLLEELPFDSRDWMAATLDLIALTAREKNLELLHDVEPDVPAVLLGDPARLRQIVLNLLSNAVKFTHAGEVCVRMSARQSSDGGDWLRIVISDTGIGVSAERIDLLFEPFTQADSTTTRLYGGTGLGLAISRRLAEEMGGSLALESVLGAGTRVELLVPVGRRDVAPAPIPADLAGTRILLVGASATGREIGAAWAGRAHMVCVSAAQATAALDLVNAGQAFDFAVIDQRLPGIDGVELGRILRVRTPRTQLILLHSGEAPKDPADRGSFDAVLARSVRQERLVEVMASLLRSESVSEALPTRANSAFDMPLGARRLSILIVEDTPVNQKVAQHLLARFGFRSEVAASGYEALQALDQRDYDLVLMDVQMPQMDGLEATRQIRAQWPGRGVQIVAMTANVAPEDVRRCYEAGMDGFLAKPIVVEALAEVLRALVLEPEAPVSEAALVDPLVVERLCSQLGAEAVREIADLFFADIDDGVPVLQHGCQVGDRAVLAATAHRLKSSARSLGAEALGQLLERVEKQAPDADLGVLTELIGRVQGQRKGVHDQLLAELGVSR